MVACSQTNSAEETPIPCVPVASSGCAQRKQIAMDEQTFYRHSQAGVSCIDSIISGMVESSVRRSAFSTSEQSTEISSCCK